MGKWYRISAKGRYKNKKSMLIDLKKRNNSKWFRHFYKRRGQYMN